LLSVLATVSLGQSFNLDIGGLAPGGAGAGTPAPTYGAAALQTGRWNWISGIDLGPFAIVNLMNNPTSVTCERTDGLGGAFGFNNSQTTGYFQALMDDAHNTGIAGTVSYRFMGLLPGAYTVYTYAWWPANSTTFTNVTVAGSTSPNPQVAGGPLVAPNVFTQGVTHTIHAITIVAGMDLVITCSGVGAGGAINGIQVCAGYELTLTQAVASMPVVVSNFRGIAGNYYANLATTVAGAFPHGPMFGLEMTVMEALDLVAIGVPFFGTLGPGGTATFSVPGLPPGLTVYCVSVEVDPALSVILSVTQPFSYTIL
jgi:hypothetical protein